MMKKSIVIICMFVWMISSCRKNYSCACTTKLTENNSIPYQTASVQEIRKNTSKKKAAKFCKNTAKQMEANTRMLFDESIDVESNCALQEEY